MMVLRLRLLLLFGVTCVGVAATSPSATATSTVGETGESVVLSSSMFVEDLQSDASRVRKLRTSSPSPSSPSPTPFPTNGPSEIPTAAPTSGRYRLGPSVYHTMWSFVCPLLSVSIMAWAVNRTTRKYVCCGDVHDTVPGEITVVNDDHSVVGDSSTDFELMPVSTLRSHEWTDCGADPKADIPNKESYDWNSDDDSITQFVRMKE
jgi:hypothetical protein